MYDLELTWEKARLSDCTLSHPACNEELSSILSSVERLDGRDLHSVFVDRAKFDLPEEVKLLAEEHEVLHRRQ